MRFLALLRKELRECLPWLLLAAVVFLALGGFVVYSKAYQPRSFYKGGFSPGYMVPSYYLSLFGYTPLGTAQVPLFLVSIGLGLALGVRQFWVAHFTRTWGFMIHRSAKRMTVLAAKLAAGVGAFLLSVGIIWVVLDFYASRPEIFLVPPAGRVFVEGWIFIALGIVTYLGTGLAGLSKAKWYTTKMFGIGFAGFVILVTFLQYRLVWACTAMTIGILILTVQIIYTFFKKES